MTTNVSKMKKRNVCINLRKQTISSDMSFEADPNDTIGWQYTKSR